MSVANLWDVPQVIARVDHVRRTSRITLDGRAHRPIHKPARMFGT
jgi:hypothetical protein